MPAERITLRVEGTAADQGHVRVADFLGQLTHLTSAIRRIGASLATEAEVAPAYFRIVALSHDSPATVVLEPRYESEAVEGATRRAVDVFVRILGNIHDSATLPEQVEYPILEEIRQFAAPIGKTVAYAEVAVNGASIRMTESFRRSVERLLAREDLSPGSLRGMLESINIHGSANVFRIYPDSGPKRVTCYFPVDLRESAIAAVGRFVEARGTLKYKSSAPYAHEIEVRELLVLPAEDDLPTFVDLLGAAPDATDGLSSEEFIRRLRNA